MTDIDPMDYGADPCYHGRPAISVALQIFGKYADQGAGRIYCATGSDQETPCLIECDGRGDMSTYYFGTTASDDGLAYDGYAISYAEAQDLAEDTFDNYDPQFQDVRR
ncbi:MAG: hypothetical protein QM597_10170 [Aeromicrobium sp.]|uniref:hypothetical protein n=1 Tax=Aeromicrobium sp. TaxID=1871063 RepID=UPI0039E38A0E